MAAAPEAMRVRPRRPGSPAAAVAAAAVVAAAVTVAIAAAVVAAVPPSATAGEVARGVAAASTPRPARLAGVGRPLAPGLSVFTDGTYGVIPGSPPPAGCPASVAIAGALGAENNSFFIPAPRVTIEGAACTGPTSTAGLRGVYGPPLSAAAVAANLTDPIPFDAAAAAAVGFQGPLTCGGKAWAGEEQGFVFLAPDGVPLAFYFDAALPARECKLAVAAAATPPAAAPAAA